MNSVEMSRSAISDRLRMAAACDLTEKRRLAAKIDLSGTAVLHRLQSVSRLRALCLHLVALGEANGLGRARRSAVP